MSALKSFPPDPPLDALLYQLLVPHGTTLGIDRRMVAHYMQYEPTAGARDDWYLDRQACLDVQWCIDLLQLSCTCKHASKFLDRMALCLLLHNLNIGPLWQLLNKTSFTMSMMDWLPVMRALIAAYLDRIVVAHCLWPGRWITIDYDTVRAFNLALGFSLGDNMTPPTRPFFQPSPTPQSVLWFQIALRFNRWWVCEGILRTAATDEDVWNWARPDTKSDHHDWCRLLVHRTHTYDGHQYVETACFTALRAMERACERAADARSESSAAFLEKALTIYRTATAALVH